MSIEENSTKIAVICTERIAGLQKHVPANTEILIDGAPKKLADVIAIFQACLDTRAVVTTKLGELKVARAAQTSAQATRRAMEKGLKQWVFTQFGATSQAAHDMGYAQPKVPTTSVETKFEAVQKSKATREARHTMGKKEKRKIKGATVASTAPAVPASVIQGTVVLVPHTDGGAGNTAPAANGASPHSTA